MVDQVLKYTRCLRNSTLTNDNLDHSSKEPLDQTILWTILLHSGMIILFFSQRIAITAYNKLTCNPVAG